MLNTLIRNATSCFMRMFVKYRFIYLSMGIFLISFICIPYSQLHHFSNMPGDLADSRFCNYLLENTYLYFFGRSASLFNLSFFYPFPYILGFSENLFGSFPIYGFGRLLTGHTDIAFLFWYSFSYFLNYFATYYVLRKLNIDCFSAVIGALIFAYAFPVSAQSGHAQLAYRFCVPLSIFSLLNFLEKQTFSDAVRSIFWLVWQLYCSIYIGFFLLALLMLITTSYLFLIFLKNKNYSYRNFISSWLSLGSIEKLKIIFIMWTLVLMLIVLFYPYFKVTELYGAKRSLAEISSMLPRFGSYFLAEGSWLWSFIGGFIHDIPMRHEHQIFIGATATILLILGLIFGLTGVQTLVFSLLTSSLAIALLITINIGGHSIWDYLADLPFASAIRAMTRFILVLLFPIAYLCSVAVNRLPAGWNFFKISLIAVLIFEYSTINALSSPISLWRQREDAVAILVPKNLPNNSILFFSQPPGTYIPAQEMDSILISLKLGYPTLNGYSGGVPPGFQENYGVDCFEISRRLNSYVSFIKPLNPEKEYDNLIKRVVPIGFSGCESLNLKNY